jgi:hypothetical protein
MTPSSPTRSAAAALIAVLALFAQEFVTLDRARGVAARQYCPVFPGISAGSSDRSRGFVDVGVMCVMTLRFDEWRRRRRV